MTEYEILDSIADSYNPILFIGYVICSALYFKQGDRIAVIKGFAGIVICYLVMFLDKATNLWGMLSLDYSTHSAVALALIVFHTHKKHFKNPVSFGLFLSLISYYLLELYQKYHSLLDIITTVMIILPLVLGSYIIINRLFKGSRLI